MVWRKLFGLEDQGSTTYPFSLIRDHSFGGEGDQAISGWAATNLSRIYTYIYIYNVYGSLAANTHTYIFIMYLSRWPALSTESFFSGLETLEHTAKKWDTADQ